MFIRIQHTDSGTATLYECGKADLIPHEEPNKVLLQLEGVPEMGAVGSVLHKGRANVYFMNGQGQTIDAYRWPVKDTGRTDQAGKDLFTGDPVEVLVNELGDQTKWAPGKIKKGDEGFVVDLELRDATKPLSSFNAEKLSVCR